MSPPSKKLHPNSNFGTIVWVSKKFTHQAIISGKHTSICPWQPTGSHVSRNRKWRHTSRAGSKECACVTGSHVDRNRKWTGTGSRCPYYCMVVKKPPYRSGSRLEAAMLFREVPRMSLGEVILSRHFPYFPAIFPIFPPFSCKGT